MTSAPNNPLMTLNTMWSDVHRLSVTSITESQISIHAAQRPSVFELQATLRQLHCMITKLP